MAKQLVHIGLAVATDGIVPGKNNILNIAACCGDAYTFTSNVVPNDGAYKESPFWVKHPDVFASLKVKPVPLTDAMTLFRTWLKQFQGTLVACASTVDFWHMLHAFFSTGKDCPFGSIPIDTSTVAMLQRGGRLRPSSVTDEATPARVARARWALVTGGIMPAFGPRKRLFTEGGDRVDALGRLLRQQRDAANTRAPRPTAPPPTGLGDWVVARPQGTYGNTPVTFTQFNETAAGIDE